MADIVSLIPIGGNFILAHFETSRCQFCTKMPEMSDLCYLGKTRFVVCFIWLSVLDSKIKIHIINRFISFFQRLVSQRM